MLPVSLCGLDKAAAVCPKEVFTPCLFKAQFAALLYSDCRQAGRDADYQRQGPGGPNVGQTQLSEGFLHRKTQGEQTARPAPGARI